MQIKKILSFDVDQTLNIAKTPIPPSVAQALLACSKYFLICPISGQKFDQFIRQIIQPLLAVGATQEDLKKFHLFVAQGTQYYNFDGTDWQSVYSFPLTSDQVAKITQALEQSARELGYWQAEQLAPGDEIIENRLSQVTFSALGQTAGTEEKYAWDPDCKKREAIVTRAKKLAPEFDFEIGGTTSINVFTPGMNKTFGMNKLMEHLNVTKPDILYFGDMTNPGGNDYPVVQMDIDTITVRSHEDTFYALQGILGLLSEPLPLQTP